MNQASAYSILDTMKKLESTIENLPVIEVTQANFNSGTLRITQPGVYKFEENILFGLNIGSDFWPTNQLTHPNNWGDPYVLGFFAAIGFLSKYLFIYLLVSIILLFIYFLFFIWVLL